MRSVFKKIKDFIWALFVICPALFVLPVVLFIAYLIATSDLPDWFKFFLLR
jgi:hypothetical protein